MLNIPRNHIRIIREEVKIMWYKNHNVCGHWGKEDAVEYYNRLTRYPSHLLSDEGVKTVEWLHEIISK